MGVRRFAPVFFLHGAAAAGESRLRFPLVRHVFAGKTVRFTSGVTKDKLEGVKVMKKIPAYLL